MTEYIRCPIPNCWRGARSLDGLSTHLYKDHIKSELIKWILNHLKTTKEE